MALDRALIYRCPSTWPGPISHGSLLHIFSWLGLNILTWRPTLLLISYISQARTTTKGTDSIALPYLVIPSPNRWRERQVQFVITPLPGALSSDAADIWPRTRLFPFVKHDTEHLRDKPRNIRYLSKMKRYAQPGFEVSVRKKKTLENKLLVQTVVSKVFTLLSYSYVRHHGFLSRTMCFIKIIDTATACFLNSSLTVPYSRIEMGKVRAKQRTLFCFYNLQFMYHPCNIVVYSCTRKKHKIWRPDSQLHDAVTAKNCIFS